jgi:hypothetical protein
MALRKRLFAIVAAASMSGLGLVGFAPSASAVSCPDNGHHNYENGKYTRSLKAGANIRTGPSTSCASVGQGQVSHSATYHCYKNVGQHTWTYLKDNTNGRSGWVREDAMVFPAVFEC